MRIILCMIYFCFSIMGLIFMKQGSAVNSNALFVIPIVEIKITAISFIGYFFYGISFLLYCVLVSKYDLSSLTPFLTGMMNILVVLSSIFVFHEKISAFGWAGISLITVGIVLMTWK